MSIFEWTVERRDLQVQPKGFENRTSKVCKLEKSLYGLKQASRMWNQRFHELMARIGFNRCKADQCLYIKIIKGVECYVLLFVDDFRRICISSKQSRKANLK